ncbi:MAG: right-handed parallel beta-helix repeat-containing protein [Planctomycetota bacterium]|nr:right-handed parallel beta-helix repeat-containing protein [Planctomycetota bacterium]
MRALFLKTLSLGLVLTLSACSSKKDQILLGQDWAVKARQKIAPAQFEIKATELSVRWKVKVTGAEDAWGVSEGTLDEAVGLPKGTKVVARIPPGTTVLTDEIVLKDINLEIIGKGSDLSRLSLNAGPRGLILKGGSLTIKNVTVSCYSSEGLTVIGGDLRAKGAVFNGGRHGLYLSDGDAIIKSCVFNGNESGLDLGKKTSVVIENSIFHGNWDAISGEKPRSLKIRRCLIQDSIHFAFDMRFGEETSLEECIIIGNSRIGWTGAPKLAPIKNNLLQYDAFEEYGVDQRINYPLDHVRSFPGATPRGLPDRFPTPTFMLHLKRFKTLGTGKSLRETRNFADDEANKCLDRAEELLKNKEWRKSTILIQVAKGFSQPYDALQKKYSPKIEELEKKLAAARKALADEKKEAKAKREAREKAANEAAIKPKPAKVKPVEIEPARTVPAKKGTEDKVKKAAEVPVKKAPKYSARLSSRFLF